MRQRIRFGARQICALSGITLGVLSAVFSGVLPGLTAFAGGFAHAFPARFSSEALCDALICQLLPLLLTLFAGCLLFARPFCSVLIALRAFAGGYVCAGLFRVSGGGAGPVVLCVMIFIFEALTLFCMNTMARLAEMFSQAARRGVKKRAVLRYLRDQLFYIGLILLFYLLRGAAALVLAS